jgi:hypothetical protein
MPIWTFDILPSDDIFEAIFNISEIDDDALTEKFDEVGYGSRLVYGNLGSLLIFQVMMWFFMAVNALILKYCTQRHMNVKVRRILERHES